MPGRRRKLITDTVRVRAPTVVEAEIAPSAVNTFIHPSNDIRPIGSTWRGNLMIWLLPTNRPAERGPRG